MMHAAASLNMQTVIDVTEPVAASGLLTAKCSRWYAIYTRSRHEKLVRNTLVQKGVESFLPLRQVLSQWKDRRKWVEKPLFPGYVFVRTQQTQLYGVAMVRGVVYVLGSGGKPTAVPDDQVEAIRQIVEAPYPTVLWPWLQEGKRVRVTAGPLAGLETQIVERKKNRKSYLVVSVDLLGRSVAVEIDPRCVEAIP